MHRMFKLMMKLMMMMAVVVLANAASATDIAGQKLVLSAQERQVQVTYFRAPGNDPRPAALLLHGANGFDSQIANYDAYAAALANHGIDAYLVYYYSNADQASMAGGVDIFAKRYLAWAKLIGDLAADLRKEKDSNGKIGLIGFSNGGILASTVSARDPDISAAVIYYGTPPFEIAGPVTRFAPLLILHGDADTIIPVEQGRRLAALAKQLGGTAELVVYPGERHGFGAHLDTANGADSLDRTIAFLQRQLRAR